MALTVLPKVVSCNPPAWEALAGREGKKSVTVIPRIALLQGTERGIYIQEPVLASEGRCGKSC